MAKQHLFMTLIKYFVVIFSVFFLFDLILKTSVNITSLQIFIFSCAAGFIGYLMALETQVRDNYL